MKVTYDMETDTLNIILTDTIISESDEIRNGIICDYDKKGNIVSIEVMHASKKITDPFSMSYAISEITKMPRKHALG